MNSIALLSTSLLRRAYILSIALSVAMHATSAMALPEPKVTITYSLETSVVGDNCPYDPPATVGGGAYCEDVSGTPFGAGDVEFVFDIADSENADVNVLVASPLLVTMEFTADMPGGNIVDGPVELVYTEFEREFVISGAATVHTILSYALARKGIGTLSGTTITWDNVVAPYQEDIEYLATCTPDLICDFALAPWPQSATGIFDVPLPDFTVLTDTIFGDSFVSDNGTPGDPSDDIDRPHPIPAARPDATVKDTWVGEEVPEPSREILLLAGALGLVGLRRLRERGGAAALFASHR